MDETLYSQIEELAELQFSVEQIATIAETTESEIKNDPTALLALRRGALRAEAEVRRAMLQMAKQGSTPAQKQFMELVSAKKRQPESEADVTGWGGIEV